jgi:hypothetical protein
MFMIKAPARIRIAFEESGGGGRREGRKTKK